MMKGLFEMTSNEYYGALNHRFNQREETLRALGFKRQSVEGLPIAVYVKPVLGKKEPLCIPACLLSCADDRLWLDRLEEVKRQFFPS